MGVIYQITRQDRNKYEGISPAFEFQMLFKGTKLLFAPEAQLLSLPIGSYTHAQTEL